jgi:hypothetical protein
MFDKEIEFSTQENYFSLKEDYPIPAKLNIPEWYKKLNHEVFNPTVKGCMPFLDTLTCGYLLKIPQDFHLQHNVKNNKNLKDSFSMFAMKPFPNLTYDSYLNLNSSSVDVHHQKQLGDSPYVEKNNNLPFYKIYNPWKIKTPNGYSCLFVPPLNNSDDRFSIIPGIVDTDTFPVEINFPIVINGDKYPILDTTIEKGTPYVQIIPFKRDSWKMKFKASENKKLHESKLLYGLKVFNNYKKRYWNKKSWK